MNEEAPSVVVRTRGYARLNPAIRRAIADGLTGVGWLISLVSLFMGANREGVWLRLPLLMALLLLLPAGWYLVRKRAGHVSPIVSGGVMVATAGVGILAMALKHASGWAALAGLMALLTALAWRGATVRAQVRGRDVRPAKRGPVTVIFDQVESLAAALVLVLLVWHFGLEAFRIPSGSMAPTLLGDPVSGDRVLVDKFAYTWRDPQRWEPVVFRYPLRRTDPYVKRCVALPGEEVLIAGGDVYVRESGSDRISVLRKAPRARAELWLPVVHDLDSKTAWVKHFLRTGEVDFADGVIALDGGTATFPRGETDDKPGNVVDHDASFGATETPKERYARHIVGDLRLRAHASIPSGGELLVTITRDEDSYRLELRPGGGACRLVHVTDHDVPLATGAMGAIALDEGSSHEVSFALVDGELLLEIDGAEAARVEVGTPLLDQLRARDAEKSISLAGPEALALAKAGPAGGRQARIALGGKAELTIDGIDRDIYYIGRLLEDGKQQTEMPFQVALGEEQYLVLGDNSAGSADCRFWTRITLFLEDGTEVTGSMDEPSQPELVRLLVQAAQPGEPNTAYHRLFRLAHFTAEERGDTPGDDGTVVIEALELLKSSANTQGRAAIDFYTEGGGYVRIKLADIERVQVQGLPYVDRKLFVGRPFAVFLSPRGMKLID